MFLASLPSDARVLTVAASDDRAVEPLPLVDGGYDAVVLHGVLEHARHAGAVLAEAQRALRPGGRLFVEAAFIQPSGGNGDYRRFTEPGLRAFLEQNGFEVERSGVAAGPGAAAALFFGEFFALLLSGRSRRAFGLIRRLTILLFAPLRLSDAWLSGHPSAHIVSNRPWAEARRRREPAWGSCTSRPATVAAEPNATSTT